MNNKALKYFLFKNQFENIKNSIITNGIYYKNIDDESVYKLDLYTLRISYTLDSCFITCNFVKKYYDAVCAKGVINFHEVNNILCRYIPITKEQFEKYPL